MCKVEDRDCVEATRDEELSPQVWRAHPEDALVLALELSVALAPLAVLAVLVA